MLFLTLFAMMRIKGHRESGVHSLTRLLVVVLVAQAAAQGMGGGPDPAGVIAHAAVSGGG